jgi:elongator complex protein 4
MSMSTMPSGQKGEISPLKLFLGDVDAKIVNSPAEWIHRIMVPNMLSPTLYSGAQCRPEEALQFLHGLRALLRRHATKVTAMITLPVALYPRSSGLTRWMEILSDGVLELVPLSLGAVHAPPPSERSDSKSEEQTQGLLRVHSLPIFHEKGGGGSDGHAREDMSFSLSRTKGLIIKPFSLPPLGEDETQNEVEGTTKAAIDF